MVDCAAEAAWLRTDLAAHPARCTLAAANTQVRVTATFGVLRLTLRLRGHAWHFVNAAGSPVTDQGQAACH